MNKISTTEQSQTRYSLGLGSYCKRHLYSHRRRKSINRFKLTERCVLLFTTKNFGVTSKCWCSHCRWSKRTYHCRCSRKSHWPQTWTALQHVDGESSHQWKSPHHPYFQQRWSDHQDSNICWCSRLQITAFLFSYFFLYQKQKSLLDNLTALLSLHITAC